MLLLCRGVGGRGEEGEVEGGGSTLRTLAKPVVIKNSMTSPVARYGSRWLSDSVLQTLQGVTFSV